MLKLPTVMLAHQSASGCHYDWMLADPRDPTGRLWTARTEVPSFRWRCVDRFELTQINSHRRAFLTYQGPLSGDRGTVQRIDQGCALAWMWADDRILLQLQMRHFVGVVQLECAEGALWRARFISKVRG